MNLDPQPLRERSALCVSWQVRYSVLVPVLCGLLVACADTNKPTSRPASIQDRQQQALQDPYEYGPDKNMPTVSGGGTKELDKKALKRDWDNFWR